MTTLARGTNADPFVVLDDHSSTNMTPMDEDNANPKNNTNPEEQEYSEVTSTGNGDGLVEDDKPPSSMSEAAAAASSAMASSRAFSVFSEATTVQAGNVHSRKAPQEQLKEQEPAADGNDSNKWWHKVWRYIKNLPVTWPRLFSLAFGVVTPVLILLCISLFFGYFLAILEGPQEKEANNAIIGERFEFAQAAEFIGNVSSQLPRICLSIQVRNETTADDFDLDLEIEKELYDIYTRNEPKRFNATLYEDDIRGIDSSEIQGLFTFMNECGTQVWNLTEQFTGGDIGTVTDLGSLSFNWVRCFADTTRDDDGGGPSTNHFNELFGSYVRNPITNLTKLRPDLQEAAVVEEWTYHQRQLESELVLELTAGHNDSDWINNMTPEQFEELIADRVEARHISVQNADGFVHCESNPDAGAWFWFTIMTTIGYGNTAPATQGGRVLVYTAGFFSILVFAVVLGHAGNIITAIFDDWMDRAKYITLLKRPGVVFVFWGCLYYAWMAVVAWKTEHWKEERIGGDFPFKDAYWFSYITTTTVGLGDFYLEHAVILRRDLIAFALLILVGFIFLATFLTKLTDVLVAIFPTTKSTNLDDRLKETDMLWHMHKTKSGADENTEHPE